MVKIKFNIGSGEIRNCYGFILPYNRNGNIRYMIAFDDGFSYDLGCAFDSQNRCFYGIDD